MFAKPGLRGVTANLLSTRSIITRLVMLQSSLASPWYTSHFVNGYTRPADDGFDALLLQDSLECLLRLAEGEDLCHKSSQIDTARRNKRNRQLVITRTLTKTASKDCLLIAYQTDGKHDVWLTQSGLHEDSTPS